MDKRHIREKIIREKAALSNGQIKKLSSALEGEILKLQKYQEAEILFAYNSINQEVITSGIIKDAFSKRKKVALPRINNGKMEFCFISSPDDCVPGVMGILEPKKNIEPIRSINKRIFMLMPGLAFDKSLNRIGYGGGFYDKYLDEYGSDSIYKVAACYWFQMVGHIDAQQYDIKADLIICVDNDYNISYYS